LDEDRRRGRDIREDRHDNGASRHGGALDVGRLALDVNRLANLGDRRALDGERRALNVDRRALNGDRRALNGDRRAHDGRCHAGETWPGDGRADRTGCGLRLARHTSALAGKRTDRALDAAAGLNASRGCHPLTIAARAAAAAERGDLAREGRAARKGWARDDLVGALRAALRIGHDLARTVGGAGGGSRLLAGLAAGALADADGLVGARVGHADRDSAGRRRPWATSQAVARGSGLRRGAAALVVREALAGAALHTGASIGAAVRWRTTSWTITWESES